MKKQQVIPFITGIMIALAFQLKSQPNPSIYTNWGIGFAKSLKNTHDMALPAFGPYSDQFNGISHVPEKNNGFRFDVAVQPSFYLRNNIQLANVKRETNYHPWNATADLSFFSYRYQLEWKDRVYCDVSFSRVDDQTRLIKAEFVNETVDTKSLALNIFSTVVFPFDRKVNAVLPDNVLWQNAVDYKTFNEKTNPWNYNLVYDGQLRGQMKDDLAVSQSVILAGTNQTIIDYHHLINNAKLTSGTLVLRYKKVLNGSTRLQVDLNGRLANTINLQTEKEFTLAKIALRNIPKGEVRLTFKFLDGAPVRLDGFALVKHDEVEKIRFVEEKLNYMSRPIKIDLPNAVILKYSDIDEYYGLVWDDFEADKRELFDSDADKAISVFNNLVPNKASQLETTKIKGNNLGWFKNIFFAPIIVKPNQKALRYAYLIYGKSETEVAEKLRLLNTQWERAESIHNSQEAKTFLNDFNKAGDAYQFSQQLMRATTLTNLIYPSFAQNRFIKHTTPGKRWNALYTWDSGFIGLGYSSINLGRALENLNAYTMNANEQSAFLVHGTPLPTQAYLFNEIWNKSQNIEYLKYFYPRLKRYYDYLGGAESSPTRRLKSNLLTTWDIFYNSGGWDDYCPQVYVHQKKLENYVAPVINTAHQIRFAKLLKMAAWQLGFKEDIVKYNADISMYTNALQQNAWDAKSGYYGYVEHDADGKPLRILKHSSGENFNMGLDGCSPLLAGICNESQIRKIISHLFTQGKLWSEHGITTIDQSSPYYDKDGYWNGRIWMPHQWFIWKTMLDLNQPDRAIQIAKTALEVWKRETNNTYNCWENFSVETGNGGGWHQFGALSSPVLNFYDALYRRGTLTHGFDVWPLAQKFNTSNDGFIGKFKLFGSSKIPKSTLLICLKEGNDYQAFCGRKMIAMNQIHKGLYTLEIVSKDMNNDIISLLISKKKP